MMHSEGKRLEYRALSIDFLDEIYNQFSDEEMCKYCSEPPCTKEEAKQIIEHYSLNKTSKIASYYRAMMIEKSTGNFIGTLGYHYLDLNKKQVEIGYDVWKAYWGQGFGSEAVEMLIQDCFDELDINQIYALIHPDNAASIRLLNKLGFVPCDPCRAIEEEPQICMSLVLEASCNG